MNSVIAFLKKILFSKGGFYYHEEELQFEKQAEDARINYFVSYKKVS